MKANILTFRVELEDTDGQVYRVIEMSDQRTVLELMCTALAAFDVQFNKLMQIQYDDLDFALAEEVDQNDDLLDADQVRISSLPMPVSQELILTYDYNQNWSFKLTLLDKVEMEKGTGNTYPRLKNGAGPGILEGRYEDYQVILKLPENKMQGPIDPLKMFQLYSGVSQLTDFDLEKENAELKAKVKKALKSYRHPIPANLPAPYEMNFRITLNGFARKLWRRITVSSNDTLDDLMKVILLSFEAEIYHLYDMEFKDCTYGTPNEYDFEPAQDARRIFLFELGLRPGDKLRLTYDYGEDWEFTVIYKDNGNEISDLSKYPKVQGGKGWGILEDDYYHFTKLISGSELSEDTIDEFMEYYGEVPDLTEFDLKENDDWVRDEMQRVYHRRGQL